MRWRPGEISLQSSESGANFPYRREPRMFVHKTQLEYVLSKEQYCSEAQYKAELEQLFQPAWHLVGTDHDLRREGDYITLRPTATPSFSTGWTARSMHS